MEEGGKNMISVEFKHQKMRLWRNALIKSTISIEKVKEGLVYRLTSQKTSIEYKGIGCTSFRGDRGS